MKPFRHDKCGRDVAYLVVWMRDARRRLNDFFCVGLEIDGQSVVYASANERGGNRSLRDAQEAKVPQPSAAVGKRQGMQPKVNVERRCWYKNLGRTRRGGQENISRADLLTTD